MKQSNYYKSGLGVLVALVVALGATALAASNTSAHTLDALVAEALEWNPELKFYEAEITAAKA